MDNLCPSGPQALASCVCLKEGMTLNVLKDITSSVKWDCSSSATEDVSSAVAVSVLVIRDVGRQVTDKPNRFSTTIAAPPRQR